MSKYSISHRWSALGYQYDWTNRVYPKTSAVSLDSPNSPPQAEAEFPARLSHLIKEVVRASGVGYTIIPEAGIVNYFPLNTTMGGHKDNAGINNKIIVSIYFPFLIFIPLTELTYEPPVVSISTGRTCLFLVGGDSKDEKPLGIVRIHTIFLIQ